jgi:hypothetical protein
MSKVSLGPYDPLRQTFAKYPKPPVRAGRKVPRYMRRPSEGSYDGVPRAAMGSWTAISTPPYFSALAIWPSIGRWTGGGAFASEREILISEAPCGMTPIRNVPIPRTVRITSGGRTHGSRMSAYQPTAVESERHVSIAETLQLSGLLRVDWISLRREPDLLFAGDGCIFRLCGLCPRRRGAVPHFNDALVDLRDMTFEQVRPTPSAMPC